MNSIQYFARFLNKFVCEQKIKIRQTIRKLLVLTSEIDQPVNSVWNLFRRKKSFTFYILNETYAFTRSWKIQLLELWTHWIEFINHIWTTRSTNHKRIIYKFNLILNVIITNIFSVVFKTFVALDQIFYRIFIFDQKYFSFAL